MIREEGYGSSGISPSAWIAALFISMVMHAALVGGILLWQRYYKPKRIFIPTYTVALLGPQVVQHKASPRPKPAPKKMNVQSRQPKKVEPPPEKKSKAAWKLPKEEKKKKPKPTAKKRKTKKEKPKKKQAQKAKKAQKTKKAATKKPAKKKQPKKVSKPAPEAEIAKALAKISREVGQVKPGSSRGVAANPRAVETRFQSYYNTISKKVKDAWVFPPEVDEGERLEAIVTITIKRDGNLEKVELEATSGNVFFDRSVLRAVRKAAPFPPLPKGYLGDTMEIGIRFRP